MDQHDDDFAGDGRLLSGGISYSGVGAFGAAAATEEAGSFSKENWEEQEECEEEDDQGSVTLPVNPSGTQATHNIYQGLLTSEQHFLQEQARQYENLRNQAISTPKYFETPTTAAEQIPYIKRLFEAIKNTTNVVDNPVKLKKGSRPAQAVVRIESGAYPDLAVEMECWKIFRACQDIHMGLPLIAKHHVVKKKDEYETFNERMEKVILACSRSKAYCKQLLDADFRHRLVWAPEAELRQKKNNNKINTERNKQNRIGREAIKRNIKEEDLSNIIKTEDAGSDSNVFGDVEIPVPESPSTSKVGIASRKKRAKIESPPEEWSFDNTISDAVATRSSKRRATPKAKYMLASEGFDDDDDEEYVPGAMEDEPKHKSTIVKRKSGSRQGRSDTKTKSSSASVKFSRSSTKPTSQKRLLSSASEQDSFMSTNVGDPQTFGGFFTLLEERFSPANDISNGYSPNASSFQHTTSPFGIEGPSNASNSLMTGSPSQSAMNPNTGMMSSTLSCNVSPPGTFLQPETQQANHSLQGNYKSDLSTFTLLDLEQLDYLSQDSRDYDESATEDFLPSPFQGNLYSQDDVDHYYKVSLCQVLGVDQSHASYLDLSQLRAYARAVDSKYWNDRWKMDEYPQYFFINRSVYDEATGQLVQRHLAQAIKVLEEVAIERGELNVLGGFNEAIQPTCHNLSEFQLWAPILGSRENPLGIFRGYSRN